MNRLARILHSVSPGGRELQRLRRAARGNARDLEQLYEEHVDGLYGFVFYRVGGDAALAEDVVQSIFVLALDRFDRYSPDRGTVQAWLRSLSRNVIRDALRAHRRGAELASIWEQFDRTLAQVFATLEDQPLSDELLARAETRDLVNMTITNLPRRYRSVLEQKYVSGDSIEEIARRQGLSQGAVKSLLARARRAFREAFSTLAAQMAEVK